MGQKTVLMPVLALFVFSLLGSVTPAWAAPDAAAKCKDTKAKVAGKLAASMLKAVGKNAKKQDPGKLATAISKAQLKYAKGFVKAESNGGCEITGDAASIQVMAGAFVEVEESLL